MTRKTRLTKIRPISDGDLRKIRSISDDDEGGTYENSTNRRRVFMKIRPISDDDEGGTYENSTNQQITKVGLTKIQPISNEQA